MYDYWLGGQDNFAADRAAAMRVEEQVNPAARVVYAGNDPIVLAHAHALLASTPQGRCDYIEADARNPEKILAAAVGTLDFGRPVAVMMLAVLHFIPDADDPQGLVRRYLSAVPSGSYLAITHAASDIQSDAVAAAARGYNANAAAAITARPRPEVTGFFAGLDLVAPGVVPLSDWESGENAPAPWPGTPPLPVYAALARKP